MNQKKITIEYKNGESDEYVIPKLSPELEEELQWMFDQLYDVLEDAVMEGNYDEH